MERNRQEIPKIVTDYAKKHCPIFNKGHVEDLDEYKKASVYGMVMDDDGIYGLPILYFYKRNIWGKYIVTPCKEFSPDVLFAISHNNASLNFYRLKFMY